MISSSRATAGRRFVEAAEAWQRGSSRRTRRHLERLRDTVAPLPDLWALAPGHR